MLRKALPLASGLILIALAAFLLATSASAAPTPTSWSQTYGGPLSDKAYAMIKTSEGGYALAGTTNSFGTGLINAWLVKTDIDGNELWNQTYSGLGQGIADAITQTNDGGYALTGYTYSFEQSNSTTTSGQTANTGKSTLSMWILRTDYLGDLYWNQTYSQLGTAVGYSIIQTSDEGFAVVGTSDSLTSNGVAAWLLKVDGFGDLQWYKTFIGIRDEELFSIIQTSDGGYLLGGDTDSINQASPYAFWLVKTDSNGVQQWNQTYPMSNDCTFSTMVPTSDGGYMLIGTIQTTTGNLYLIVKTNSSGNMEWYQTYGLSTVNDATSGIQTSDGGYAITGYTANSTNSAIVKTWLVKTDARGNPQWNQTYGGEGVNIAGAIAEANNGGYALGGYTNSTGAGEEDFWLIKTDANGVVAGAPTSSPVPTTSAPTASPTSPTASAPAGTLVWTFNMTLIVVAVLGAAMVLGGVFAVKRNPSKTKGRELEEQGRFLEAEGKPLEAALSYAKACQANLNIKSRQTALKTLGKYVSTARPIVLNTALSNTNAKQLRKISNAHMALAKSISSKNAQELLPRSETQKVRDLGALLENCLSLNLDFVVDRALKDKALKKQLQTTIDRSDKISVADAAAKLGYSAEATLKLLLRAADQHVIAGHITEDNQTFVSDIYRKK